MDKIKKADDEKKSIGFFYQDYVALKYLITLNEGETLGIEVYDDIHHETIYGSKTLIQVKHSINCENYLTNKDIDLWKTLYNWSNMYESLDDEDISFYFYTNKLLTQENGIVKLLAAENKNIEEIRKEIDLIENQHENKKSKLYKYIHHIHSLNSEKIKKIINNFQFVLDDSQIIHEIKNLLKHMAVPENKIDDVFHSILGSFTDYKYNQIKQTKKVQISYELFRKTLSFDRTIQLSRNIGINFNQFFKFKSAYPNDIKKNISYNQLKDLGFDIKFIIEYCNHMAKTEAFLQHMIDEGELANSEYEDIHSIGESEWRVHHSINYLGNNFSAIDQQHIDLAQKLYIKLITNCMINIDNSSLPRDMVIGTLIKLSDVPRIGWLQNWEDLYK